MVDDGDVFLPLRLGPQAATVRTSEDYNIVARLASGVTVAEARTCVRYYRLLYTIVVAVGAPGFPGDDTPLAASWVP